MSINHFPGHSDEGTLQGWVHMRRRHLVSLGMCHWHSLRVRVSGGAGEVGRHTCDTALLIVTIRRLSLILEPGGG